MKKLIRISLFSMLLAGGIFSNLILALPQKMLGLNLAEILTINLAFAEEPKIEPAKGFESVTCTKTTEANGDGTTTTIHKVVCYGINTLECKCPGH